MFSSSSTTFKSNTVVKHMTNDFSFVGVMEAAILKILIARRQFLLFFFLYREAFTGKEMVLHNTTYNQSFRSFEVNCFVCAYKVEPNLNRSQHIISNGQEEGRVEKQYRNQTKSKDTYLYLQNRFQKLQ